MTQNIKQTILIFTLLISCWQISNAQDVTNDSSWIGKHPIEISSGTHAIGLPFSNFLSSPFYSELNMGLQSTFSNKKNIALNMVNGIGFANHPFNGNRYFVDTYFRVKYKFPLNIYSQIGLGAAFNILTFPNESFELNSNGVYEEKKSVETKFYTGFNIEIGYHLTAIKKLNLDIFSKYSAGVNLFHHPQIPVFPYNSTQIGLRFYFKK